MKLANVFVVTLALSCFQAAAQPQPAPQFLVISDIHFNPLADPGLATKLAAAEPTQWEAIFSGDSNSPPAKYGDDTTWSLLAALVSGVQNVTPRPKLVVVTGDILPHKFQEKFAAATGATDPTAFRSFVTKTFAFIALELQKAMGGNPVIYTLGNNDDECGDYALEPDGPFLLDTKEIVQNLAQVDAPAMAQWPSLGSYVKENPLAPHRRIIALNTNFWSRRYTNSCAEKGAGVVDPGKSELAWLSNQLKIARDKGDKVWIVYHIPPGIDGHSSARTNQVTPMWKPGYEDSFDNLMDQYRNTIDVSLAGHTHLDDMRLVKTPHTETLVLLNPAVSPNIGQNPAFRLITLDSHARPEDVETYYIPNLQSLKWELEYNARSAYGLRKIDAKSYRALYRRMDQSPAIAEKWKMYYSVSRLAGLGDSKSYLRALYCATGYSAAADFLACISAH